ncbi:ATP-binding cassette domain-containing protein [Nakamurella sp. GG22]
MTTIEIRELTKQYGRTRAVDHLTFAVHPGRVTGFLGPNGAGKSTTMRLILGLDRPTSGSAMIDGRPFASFSKPLREVGALLDPQAAHGGRTARNHLRALAVTNDIPRGRVDEVLDQSGIGAAGKRRIKTFSLGMRQRLGIAAALLGDPAVLMFDEPTNGLDPEGISWMRETLRELATAGRTVLVSSHLMTETALTVGHLVIVAKGRLLVDMSMQQFIESRGASRVRVRSAEPERLRAALADRGIDLKDGSASDDRSQTVAGVQAEAVGAIATIEGIPLLELVDEHMSLEQAYLDLTTDQTEFAAGSPTVEKRG